MVMSMKQYIGAPEPFDAKTDDWILDCQHFKLFLLANGITDDDDDPKETLVLGNDGWSKTIEEMKNAKECLSKDEGYTLIYITASVSHQ